MHKHTGGKREGEGRHATDEEKGEKERGGRQAGGEFQTGFKIINAQSASPGLHAVKF